MHVVPAGKSPVGACDAATITAGVLFLYSWVYAAQTLIVLCMLGSIAKAQQDECTVVS